MKTDITDRVGADLREIAERRVARIYRLSAGTLMIRNPTTLDTRFFHDEGDALGQLRDGQLPKARKP
jgi:hypothetical protein